MSTSQSPSFSVTEHVIDCQHIREYPHGTKAISDHHDSVTLKLAIKEYRPLDDSSSSSGSTPVTIIAAHGNGFPKEAYEPLFEELHQMLKGRIRAVWFADCANQGASGVLNESVLGDDPNWFDHSRDLLSMVNHFGDAMIRPIFGIGHSFGAAQLAQLSHLHPRLFHGLALVDPVIQLDPPSGPNVALPTSLRRDLWPSRSAAESSFFASKFFQRWDPRALNRYLQYGLRELPTYLFPTQGSDSQPRPVTLTTTKHQEAWTYVRPNFVTMPNSRRSRLVAPDSSEANARKLFDRPEMARAFIYLPFVRPDVLWLFGQDSMINTPEAARVEKVARTGTGIGGSGGVELGRVKSVVVENTGHLLPFEDPKGCASALGSWLAQQIEDFEEVETFLQEHDSGKSEEDSRRVSKLFLEKARLDPNTKRDDKSRL
ncbi:MAG: hypothetical protein Q9195_006493 [Heterodermia aff. obscurata]